MSSLSNKITKKVQSWSYLILKGMCVITRTIYKHSVLGTSQKGEDIPYSNEEKWTCRANERTTS